MAVRAGGVEECPVSASTFSSSVNIPFSAVPITATGTLVPGKMFSMINEPSSSTASSRMPRDFSSSAISFAPDKPPISSS